MFRKSKILTLICLSILFSGLINAQSKEISGHWDGVTSLVVADYIRDLLAGG